MKYSAVNCKCGVSSFPFRNVSFDFVYRDGFQYSGDPLRLPAMFFDGYKVRTATFMYLNYRVATDGAIGRTDIRYLQPEIRPDTVIGYSS